VSFNKANNPNSSPLAPLTVASVSGLNIVTSNASVGGGLSHNNVQPGTPVYYIMYIP